MPLIHPSWFLYLLECQDGSIYTGITTDVTRRYQAHNSGTGARYTRMHPPRRLIAVFSYPNRATAARAEYFTKRLSAQAKRQLSFHQDNQLCQ
jgi:putative endonuclease